MKKILSILICVVLGISSAWAKTVTSTMKLKVTTQATCDPTGADASTTVCTSASSGDCAKSLSFTQQVSADEPVLSGSFFEKAKQFATWWATFNILEIARTFDFFLETDINVGNEEDYIFSHWTDSDGNIIEGLGHQGVYTYKWMATNGEIFNSFGTSLSAKDPSKNITLTAHWVQPQVTGSDKETLDLGTINDPNGFATGKVTFNLNNDINFLDYTLEVSDGFTATLDSYEPRSGKVVFDVSRSPTGVHGTYTGTITLRSNYPQNDGTYKIVDIQVVEDYTPHFSIPANHDFGTVYIGAKKSSDDALYAFDKNIVAAMPAPVAPAINGTTWYANITGTDASAFEVMSTHNGDVMVRFAPTEERSYEADLEVSVIYTDADGGTPILQDINYSKLTGSGKIPLVSAITFEPEALDFGEVVTNQVATSKVNVIEQNVGDVNYDFGETNPNGIFTYTATDGLLTITALSTNLLGVHKATLTATGNDTRIGESGVTTGTIEMTVHVMMQSPVLIGGSNLKDTYYLKWTKVPRATDYEIYEINGAERTLVENVVEILDDGSYITKSIASTDAEKIFVVKAIGNNNGDTYESWSNQQTVKLNELTRLGNSYIDIYTGTTLTSMSGFAGTKVAKKKVNLINTFDSNGKALFDELYVFGETVSSDGQANITAATPTSVNTAVTPCYVFTKSGDAYVLSNTIANVNQAAKQIPNASARCWTINASQNKKLYFTGFCPFGSNGSTKDDEGVIYIKGAAGASVDVYLEDCQLYARCHTVYGDSKGKDDPNMPTFSIDVSPGMVSGGAATTANAGGSASAIVFECTSNSNSTAPFLPTIHTRGDNILYSHLGCTGYFNALGKEARIGQYSATVQVRVTDLNSYTTLSFDDKWPTDATDFELHKRTNGSLKFKKVSVNGSSIEMGNENTVVNFNGGRVELQNTLPGPVYYLNTLAVCARLGYALYSGLELFVGYGLGQDVVGGVVNFNDGTVYAESLQLSDNNEFKDYLELDENGYTTALRCPYKTYITGGSHNSEIRACSAVDKIGGSPRDKSGNALVKLDYQLPGDANILTNPETGLVKPETMPNQMECVGCGEDGSNTILDLTYYGKQSLSPDKNNYIHLWAPGADRIEYSITSWVISMLEVTATMEDSGFSGTRELGGDIFVPSSATDKVNRLMYVHLDDYMYNWLSEGHAALPFKLADEYKSVAVSDVSDKPYSNIMNDDVYEIHDEMYYMRAITADEWIMFAPPFDISNIYVIETSSEAKLEEKSKNEGREVALNLQAERNMDFAAVLAAYLEQDATSTTNRGFWSHYDAVLSDYAADPTNKTGEPYPNDIVKTQLVPYTSGNYNAHFFLYESENNEWTSIVDSEEGGNEQFQPDWKIAEPLTKTIGERERTVIMEQGKVYAMQFPYCPNCEGFDPNTGDLNTRDFWDYWTGKVVVFEGYGPQMILGRNVSRLIASEGYTSENSGQLRPNPVFAEYQVNWEDENAEGYLSNALFVDPLDNLFYPGETHFVGGLLKAGDVYMVANITSPSGMPRRIASINPVSGEITYRDETTTSTPTIGGNNQMLVYNISGGVGIVPVAAQQVSIYNAAGQLVTSQYLTDEVHIPLPSGIYLIAGAQDQFKAVVK